MRTKKRLLSLLLCGAMMFSLCPQAVFAEGAADSAAIGGLCEHHQIHDESCGYTESTPGMPCTHEHTDECYTEVTNCIHEHTEDCYPAEDVSGNTAIPSEADKAEPTECSHVCSEESGCITRELDCQHEHSEDCGYSPAESGTPCTYVCEICYPQDGESSESTKSEEEKVSTPSDAVEMFPEQMKAMKNVLAVENPVASVTINGKTTEYASLSEAINAANGKTATITLLQSTDEAASIDNGNITLQMNGNSLNDPASGLWISGGTVEIIGVGSFSVVSVSSGKLVIENGAVNSLNIAGGTADLRGGNISFLNMMSGTATISGGTIGKIMGNSSIVTYAPEQIGLNKSTLSLGIDKTGALTAMVTPSISAPGFGYTWTSSAPSVATVDGNGANATVTAISAGKTNITVTAGDKTVTCSVTVTEPQSSIVNVSITGTGVTENNGTYSAVYGSSVTVTADIAEASANAKTRAAAKNTVDFYLGSVADENKLNSNSIAVTNNKAVLTLPLTGEKWKAGTTYTILVDFGGSDTMTGSSGTAALNVSKAEQTGKPTVSVSETTTNSITVTASDSGQGGYEYACVEGENASVPTEGWQTTNTFSNLFPGTAYTVFARFAGDAYYKPSPASDGVTAYTIPAMPEASAVTINYATETVSFDSTLEVNTTSGFNGENIKSGESIANYIKNTNQTIYVRVKANGNIPASAEQTVTIPARPAAPESVEAVDEEFQGEKGKITDVTTAMEYTAYGKEEWSDCGAEEVILPAGTYQVRFKATDSKFASQPVEVEIKAGAERTYTLNITAPVFDSVREGYGRQDAKALAIASTGNSDTTVNSVSLSGEGAKAFTLNKTNGTTISAGKTDSTTYTIQPKTRLSVGTYTATVTVSYHDNETASAEVSFKVLRRWEPSRPTDGLHPDSNGDLWYYKDGRIDKTFEGMVTYDGSQFYVKDGKVQKIDGLKLVKETWYFLTKGRVQTQHTGLVQYDGEWFYVTKGILDTTISGVIPYDGGEFVFTQGRLIQELTGLWLNPGDNTWYFIANGQVQRNYTGLALYDGHWFHVVNGIFDQTYTGLVIYNNAWFYVTKGELNTTISGVIPYNGGTFIFTAGRLANEANGLWLNPKDKKWYFASNGQIQTQYTGVAMYDNEWFYIRKGMLASDYTGTIQYNGATFRVQAGQLYNQIR